VPFFVLPIAWLALEVFAFIEVGLAIGFALATGLLVATSLLGLLLLRVLGKAAVERISLAIAERRAPGRAALDGALGFLGCVLLVAPGFVSDGLGVLLVFPATRALVRLWIARRYARRVMAFAASAARFSSRGRGPWPADVESTAVEEDQGRLDA
jgi:UPF0716 protein FxsA